MKKQFSVRLGNLEVRSINNLNDPKRLAEMLLHKDLPIGDKDSSINSQIGVFELGEEGKYIFSGTKDVGEDEDFDVDVFDKLFEVLLTIIEELYLPEGEGLVSDEEDDDFEEEEENDEYGE